MFDFYQIEPVAKPRQTQRDKWAKRPAVLRYRAFCDEVRLRNVHIPFAECRVIFLVQMPESWSKKRKAEMDLTPHLQRPDLDNFIKAINDAQFGDDSMVWDMRGTKLWSTKPGIVVSSTAQDASALAPSILKQIINLRDFV
jgi:Holliday junction resolvase RusA-like endonuclease